MDPSIGLSEVEFTKVNFWVQVHDLGYEKFSPENARRVGDKIGKCIDVESNETLTGRSFLRIKVEVEVQKPLMAGFWWKNSQGAEKWATIKYERLSDFCYGCGTLGHTTQTCKEEVARAEQNTIAPAYGPWLIGTTPKAYTQTEKQAWGRGAHNPGDKKQYKEILV